MPLTRTRPTLQVWQTVAEEQVLHKELQAVQVVPDRKNPALHWQTPLPRTSPGTQVVHELAETQVGQMLRQGKQLEPER